MIFAFSVLIFISRCSDVVTSLPGFGEVKETQFAGFVEVNPNFAGNLFYWFIASSTDRNCSSSETPLVIWLNGGPGASSLTGAFAENGPYVIEDDGTKTSNAKAWTRVGHMLYIDNPVGSGYSYVNKGGYADGEGEVAEQFRLGIQGFFEKHPTLRTNDLYITGESYAGKYIPHIAWEIVTKNEHTSDPKINLKGLLIGNGLYDPLNQFEVLPDYYNTLGMVSEETIQVVKTKYLQTCKMLYEIGKFTEAFNWCNNGSNLLNHEAGDIFLYDIRVEDGSAFDLLSANLAKYLNTADVMTAFHTNGHKWKQSDGTSSPNPVSDALASDIMKNNTLELFQTMIDGGCRIMLFVGNMDGSVCGVTGQTKMVKNFYWHGRDAFWANPRVTWKTSAGQVGGYIRSGGGFTFNIIHNSGHLVPKDQPLAALEMVYRYISKSGWTEKIDI